MEGNKDEADRCVDIGIAALKTGNIERAEKFFRKAENLYPMQRTKSLLESLRQQQNNENSSSSANRPNAQQPRKRATPNSTEPAAPVLDKDYTSAQLEMVQRIKKCKDYYEVLCISKDCTDSEIKKAYKKLALQLHPDKNRAPGAVEAFKAVGNAVAVLTDPQKRKRYDMYGAEGSAEQSSYMRRNNNQYDHAYTRGGGFESDFTAEELFNMFFSNSYGQRMDPRARQQHNQRQDTRQQQPSMAFGLILVLIVISMLSSFFTTDPVYSLSASTRYPVARKTTHLSVPYFVREKFESEYQGSLSRLENSVEEEYITVAKQGCFRERNYREMMISRARSYGSQTHFKQAQDLKAPSCERLAAIGITKYMPY